MSKFRVWVQVPGEDRPKQAICATRKMADEFLRLVLDAGQPKGTIWRIWQTEEVIASEGVVD